MVNMRLRSSCVVGAWMTALAIILVVSGLMGANASTTALLVALGVALGIVSALLAHCAPSQTVAQLLYSVQTKDGQA